MQYMLLIYEAPGQWPEDEQDQMMRDYFAYTEELRESGAYVAGDALQGPIRRRAFRCARDTSASEPRGIFLGAHAATQSSVRPGRDLVHCTRAATRGASLHAAWASSGDAIASLPAGSCLSVLAVHCAAEPAFRLTPFTARRARFTCSSPTKAALRKAPRITARAPSGVA